ncbi:hypothetical protein WJX72_003538 [[Myrmecia] bisecta]|uniref:Uncharacterized protein n=1 Tax=[Myrmecia] bisecta TaxID=41462 RepID=A0AAW1PEV6_9CHLO
MEDEEAEAGFAPGTAAEAPEGPSVVRKAAKLQKEDPLAFSTKSSGLRLETFKYESSRALQQQTDQGATATLETETQHDRDARALREAVLRQGEDPDAVLGEEGSYKGMNNYVDYRKGFRREHTIGAEKGSGAHGPLRGSVNIRSTVRFDYQPDVCKDYKETGFCGYGDACKFVHDRSDYKSGWELEREWDQKQKQLADKKIADWDPDIAEASGGSGEEDELPFACYICRKPWEECSEPVITRCKHYFCETCALKHNAKSGKCAVCEQPTNGLFNIATDVLKRQKQKQRAVAG